MTRVLVVAVALAAITGCENARSAASDDGGPLTVDAAWLDDGAPPIIPPDSSIGDGGSAADAEPAAAPTPTTGPCTAYTWTVALSPTLSQEQTRWFLEVEEAELGEIVRVEACVAETWGDDGTQCDESCTGAPPPPADCHVSDHHEVVGSTLRFSCGYRIRQFDGEGAVMFDTGSRSDVTVWSK